MGEERVEITLEEMRRLDVVKRMREFLESLEKEFKGYEIDNIGINIEAGIPSGVKGTLGVTLKKKTEGKLVRAF